MTLASIPKATPAVFTAILLAALLGAGCDNGGGPKAPLVPEFDDPQLREGRNVWMQVCRNCHLMGVAGAPAISDYQAWQPRLSKGAAALQQSAIQGIRSETGWSMPPRGGNSALSDSQVRLAVDFMMTAVRKTARGGRR